MGCGYFNLAKTLLQTVWAVDFLNKCEDFTQTIRQKLCTNVETLHIFKVDTLHIEGDFTHSMLGEDFAYNISGDFLHTSIE